MIKIEKVSQVEFWDFLIWDMSFWIARRSNLGDSRPSLRPKMSKRGQKWSKMVKNRQKWPNFQNSCRRAIWPHNQKCLVRRHGHSETIQDPSRSRSGILREVKNGQNGQKWSKMAKMAKMAIFSSKTSMGPLKLSYPSIDII